MKYYQPETLAETADLLAAEAGAKIIAGGQSMMPLLRQDLVSPGALVDISRVEDLDATVTVEDEVVRVGALTTYTDLLDHEVCAELGLLRDSLEAIGDKQVRNAGTIGGGVAHADPAQDLPPALQCYGADVVVSNGDTVRRHDINEFFIDFYFTELAPDEVITAVEIDRPPAGAGGAFAKHARTPGGFSEAGVAAQVVPGADGYEDVRLAYCAGAPVPRRVPREVETELAGGPLTRERITDATEGVVGSLDTEGDVDDSDDGAFTEHLFRVLTKRALVTAAERSEGPEVER